MPAEQKMLPSPAGGGPIEVAQDDPEGLRAVESFYLITATLTPAATSGVALLDQRTGEIRLHAGTRPLALQLWHDARQILHRRLRL